MAISDAWNRDTIWQLIKEARARGTAILRIFHDQSARDRVCDRGVDVATFTPDMSA